MWAVIKHICCSKQFQPMRILFLSILSIVNVFAAETYSQNTKLTLDLKSTTIEKVMDEIENQSEFYFMYNQKLVDIDRTVTIDVKNTRIKDILTDIFKNTDTKFFVVDRQILLMPKNMSQKLVNNTLGTDQQKITGKVTDANGEPLPGAVILVAGTNNAVVTDLDGDFNLVLNAAQNVTLEITYLGMEKLILKWNGETHLNIILKTSDEILDEVFITGYQNISGERATGAFAKINESDMEEFYSPDVINLLEGKVAGMVVDNNGDITIRGVSTFRANKKPLIVIDGLPAEGKWNDPNYSALDDINPNDIASITVLKDAAASSIYGARAANGVIVVTTKKAKVGKPEISIAANFTMTPRNKNNHLNLVSVGDYIDYEQNFLETSPEYINGPLAYFDYRDGQNLAYSPVYYQYRQWLNGNISESEAMANIQSFKNNEEYRKQYNDYALQNRLTQQYNISFKTANERSNLVLSMNALADKTEQINAKLEKYTFYFKNEQKIRNWLTIGYGANIVLGQGKTPDVRDGNGWSNARPYEQIVDANGNRAGRYLINQPWAETLLERPGLYDLSYNVLDELDMNKKETKYSNVRLFTNVGFKFTDYLSYDLMFQYEIVNTKEKSYYSEETYRMRHDISKYAEWEASPVWWLPDAYNYHLPQGGSLLNGNFNQNNYTLRNQLNFNKVVKELHAITALAGVEIRENEYNATRSNLYGYNDQSLAHVPVDWYTLSRGVPGSLSPTNYPRKTPLESNREDLNRYFSVYLNAGYTYNGKYSFTGSFRIDQTNLFGTDPKYRYRPLWSVGASWLVSGEDFMENADWVNFLKVRTSYGISGNVDQRTSPYLIASFSNDQITGDQSTIIHNAPNPLLRWEKTSSYNFGIDFGFLDNRLGGSLDVYTKYSDDLLAIQQFDPALGFVSGVVNNGAMSNNGFEIGLSYDWLKKGDWSLRTNFTTAYNKNEVKRVDLEPTVARDLLILGYNVEGNPINSIYAYRYAGLTDTGDPSVYDENGDVVSNVDVDSPDALKFMGQLDPKWTGSFQPVVTYKGFDLSALLLYEAGHVKRDNVTPLYESVYNSGGSVHGDIVNRWTPQNTDTEIPRMATHDPGNNTFRNNLWRYADTHVVSANEITLRNIFLAYTLSQKVADKIKSNLIQFNFQVNNPWYSTKVTSNYRSLPRYTSYMLGVNLKF
jgi:TonB-linked SusC/RagA family outer membrane protein